jgi:hypothetical protein
MYVRAANVDSVLGETIDTGAFAPGNRDFSRYTVPEMCVATVRSADESSHAVAAQYELAVLHDTAPERDTLSAQSTAMARACGARFTLTGTAPTDLPGLFTLALMMGNDQFAQDIVRRQLTLAPDANTRQAILAAAVQGYAGAKPARLSDANWAVTMADSLALRDHANSLPAHIPLLELAHRAFDRPRLRREAERLIAVGQTLNFDAIKYYDVPLIRAWQEVLTVAFVEQPDSVLAFAQRAKTDLGRFPLGPEFPPGIPYSVFQLFDFKGHTPVETRDFLIPFNPKRYQGAQALPPVTARYWFPAQPPVWPPRGHISLVLYRGWEMQCARDDGPLMGYPLANGCAVWHTYFRNWLTRYGARDGHPGEFTLTAIERTVGSAVRSIVLSEAAEADSLNWYYRTYLGFRNFPFTLGVVATAPVNRIPEPDGRFLLADTTMFGRRLGSLGSPQIGLAILYDRAGTLMYAGDFDAAVVGALIEREVAKQ